MSLKRGKTATITKAVESAVEEDEGTGVTMSTMPDVGQKKASAEPEFFSLKTEALDEKLAAQQQRVSARLSRMKEMQEIVAMSYTGPSRVEDSSGKYEGDISKGQKSGKGVMKFRNGDIYTGVWQKDMMNGEGIMVYGNGEKYYGEWVNDRRNGLGCHLFSDSTRYEGQWLNDDMHGLGTFYFRNGSVYQGEWIENRRHGIKLCVLYIHSAKFGSVL